MSQRRALARAATGLGIAALVYPVVTRGRLPVTVGTAELVRVEFAGTGAALLSLADSDATRLEAYRRLLGRSDNVFVVVYSAPVLLGVALLPPAPAVLGMVLAAIAAGADVVENESLERALSSLLHDPGHPDLADSFARDARRAAGVKFALLVPALTLGVWGMVRGLRGSRSTVR